jgi:hypothetical protein
VLYQRCEILIGEGHHAGAIAVFRFRERGSGESCEQGSGGSKMFDQVK